MADAVTIRPKGRFTTENICERVARRCAVPPLAFESVLSMHDDIVALGSKTTWPIGIKVRKSIYSRDNDRCYYCGSPYRLTIDHKVPQSVGGSDHSDNLVTACKSCNSAKKAKHIDSFIRHRFGGGAA